jgi:hypothetical protein
MCEIATNRREGTARSIGDAVMPYVVAVDPEVIAYVCVGCVGGV